MFQSDAAGRRMVQTEQAAEETQHGAATSAARPRRRDRPHGLYGHRYDTL